jgi:transcription termination factor Rho
MLREELKKLTVKELKEKCKELGIAGYSNKKEDELIDKILEKVAEKTEEAKELTAQKKEVTFIKLFKGNFAFGGKVYTGAEFTLNKEDAEHPRIKTALRAGLIKIKG